MVNERFSVLLSPPTSPRMSEAAAKKGDPYNSYAQHSVYQPSSVTSQATQGGYNSVYDRPYDDHHSTASSYNGLPRSVISTEQNTHSVYGNVERSSAGSGHHHWNPQSRQPSGTMDAQHYAHSASASPVDRLTPRSPSNTKDQHDDDDLIDFGGEDDDQDADKPPLTAAEIRAQKRKMKRFRLTHNQTRFLMNEFSNQAHPDAAHRERLAREIPGLTSRQVQVWFQNRRAKLKRMTQGDQERMLRSRALPAGFDTTQALHSPFGVRPPMGGTISNLGSYAPYGEHSAIRPLTLDTLRRVPEYEHHNYQYGTPSGVSPALGAFGFTPPQSATEHLSPGSTTSGISSFTLQQPTAYDASRRPPLGLPGSSQAQFPAQSSMPRLPLHERLSRTTGEAGSSPLRASVSYSALGSVGSQQEHQFGRAASFSDHGYAQQRPGLQRNVSNPNLHEQSAYGLGFSYQQQQPPTYHTSEPQQHQNVQSQTPTDTETFRRTGLPVSTTTTAYSPYTSSNFSTTQQYGAYATQYPSQQFGSSGYQQSAAEDQNNQQPREYAPAHEQAPQYLQLGGSVSQSY